jgi:hypothetical protein
LKTRGNAGKIQFNPLDRNRHVAGVLKRKNVRQLLSLAYRSEIISRLRKVHDIRTKYSGAKESENDNQPKPNHDWESQVN